MDAMKPRTANGAYGLHRRYVTCQEIFERETQQIFGSNWICLIRESELLGGSGIMPVEFEANKFVLVRDENGVIGAFRNFCRHRGSQLVTSKNCQTMGQRIQCPYHAWTYNRSGKLVSAPNMDSNDSFSLDEFGLIRVACETHGGFVWINLSPREPLPVFLKPLEDQFTDWGIAELTVVAELEYQVRANWKLIFQNYNECYHCPVVHPALNRLTPYQGASNLLETGAILGGPMGLADGCETMSTDGNAIANSLPRLNAKQIRSVNYFTIFPTIFLSTHPDYVLIHRLERVSVNETTIKCWFLAHPDSAFSSTFDPKPAVEFWDVTNKQDWEVCEAAQSGMQDPAYQAGPYSDLESVLAAFDQHYLGQLNQDTGEI